MDLAARSYGPFDEIQIFGKSKRHCGKHGFLILNVSNVCRVFPGFVTVSKSRSHINHIFFLENGAFSLDKSSLHSKLHYWSGLVGWQGGLSLAGRPARRPPN